jgi:hypothetical protein
MAFTSFDPHPTRASPDVDWARPRAGLPRESPEPRSAPNDPRRRRRTVKALAITCIAALGAVTTWMMTSTRARDAIASWSTMGEVTNSAAAVAPSIDDHDRPLRNPLPATMMLSPEAEPPAQSMALTPALAPAPAPIAALPAAAPSTVVAAPASIARAHRALAGPAPRAPELARASDDPYTDVAARRSPADGRRPHLEPALPQDPYDDAR